MRKQDSYYAVVEWYNVTLDVGLPPSIDANWTSIEYWRACMASTMSLQQQRGPTKKANQDLEV